MNLSTPLDYQVTNPGWKANWFTAHRRNFKNFSSFFVTISCFVAIILGNSAFAQFTPASCGDLNCTSNDVRIIRSYLSGPNNSAINCSAPDPFLNAELHLIVSSNTQRVGVSISGTLTANGTDYAIGKCYGVPLNNGSDNNLVYNLTNQLVGVQCGSAFSLKNVFTSWGTGNKNFCTSGNPQCPATPAKCRYVPGESIIVDVKLEVFFSWQVGSCSSDNKRPVSFTSELDLGADIKTSSTTYAWDFDNNGTTDETSANPTHSFAPGTYPVTLTVSATSNGGASVGPKSITRTVVIEECCNLGAPDVSGETFCSSQGKKLSDLNPQADGGYFSWFNGADPSNSFEVDANTVIPVGTNTYWISYSKNGCESGRTEVTVTVLAAPNAGTDGTLNICAGSTVTEAQLFAVIGTHDAGSWTPALAGAGVYTYTVSATSPCTDATATVTVTEQAQPKAGADGTLTICAGSTVTEAQLFARLVGSPDEGGSWTPTLAGAGTYTYTVTATEPCSVNATAQVIVSADPVSAATISLTGNNPACSGNNSGTITVSSKTGNIVKWESSTDGATWSTYAAAGTGNSFPFSNLTATTWFRVVVKSGVCAEASSTPIKITVNVCTTTFTQGYYGNANGSGCNGSNLLTTRNLLLSRLLTTPLTIGGGASTVTIPSSAAGVDKLILVMPGGGTPNKLVVGNYDITNNPSRCTNCFDAKYLSSGKINNVLLSQTIALGLNLRNSTSLGSIKFVAGKYILSTAATQGCPQTEIANAKGTCYSLSKAVVDYLISKNSNATIQNLYDLANSILGGTSISGITYSDVNTTVDAINRGFDQGRMLLGFSTSCGGALVTTQATSITSAKAPQPEVMQTLSDKLTISAFPNPYQDKVRFVIQSPVSGQATLDVFNMLGQKVQTVFNGHVQAGIGQSVEYNVPKVNAGNLMYILRVGDQKTTGKLLH